MQRSPRDPEVAEIQISETLPIGPEVQAVPYIHLQGVGATKTFEVTQFDQRHIQRETAPISGETGA